jgi:hypothetical protein
MPTYLKHPGPSTSPDHMIKLNTQVRLPTGYDAPPVPESLCSPDALADLLVHARAWRKAEFLSDGAPSEAAAPLSDAGLRNLIDLAFYTSLVPEEGRHPCFKMVSQKYLSSLVVSRFEPVPLDVSRLRRLAPACTRPDCALLITEQKSRLHCEGVVCIGGLAYSVVPGQPGVFADSRTAEMLIEVFGPGHFRATELWPGYEYRAGRVRALSGFDAPPAAEALAEAIEERITRKPTTRGGGREPVARDDVRTALLYVLARVFRTAVDARHGGAFVFLPAGMDDPAICGLRVLYQTKRLNLGEDLVDLLDRGASCREGGGRNNSIALAERSRAKLLTDAEAVGNFSLVDGCVVLGQDLRVFGFGATIEVSPEEAARGQRFKHIESGEVYEDRVFMREIGGTRHQSVARLCQANPGAMAYTVSQDGDLKLFYSDTNYAYVYGPLDLPTIDGELFVS